MKKIGIFGTSGMAREAGDVAFALGFEPIYVAYDKTELEASGLQSNAFLESDLADYDGLSFVIGVGDNSIRRRLAENYADKLDFVNLIHPKTECGMGQMEVLQQSKGLVVCTGVSFTNSIRIGDFCIINRNTTVGHDCVIGSFVHLAPGSIISGNVLLETGVSIGAGAIINQGSREEKLIIGENTIIGSGSVVTRSCLSNSVYAGVPVMKIK